VKKNFALHSGSIKLRKSIITCVNHTAHYHGYTESGLRQGYIEICINESGECALVHTLARVDHIKITSDKRLHVSAIRSVRANQVPPHVTGDSRLESKLRSLRNAHLAIALLASAPNGNAAAIEQAQVPNERSREQLLAGI